MSVQCPPWRPEENTRLPGAGVSGKVGPLGKHQALVISQLSRPLEMPFLPPKQSKISPIHVNTST